METPELEKLKETIFASLSVMSMFKDNDTNTFEAINDMYLKATNDYLKVAAKQKYDVAMVKYGLGETGKPDYNEITALVLKNLQEHLVKKMLSTIGT